MRVWATIAACLVANSAFALSPFSLTAKGFGELAPTGAASALVVSHFQYPPLGQADLYGTALSQVYHLSDGRFLYLYQVINESADDVVEQVQVSRFRDPVLSQAGYLSDLTGLTLDSSAPGYDGFIAGGMLPQGQTYFENTYKVSYQYMPFPHYLPPALPPGQTSWTPVFFLISPDGPGSGTLQVIDGGTSSMSTLVAVIPEPLTLCAIGVSLVGTGAYTRRRIRVATNRQA